MTPAVLGCVLGLASFVGEEKEKEKVSSYFSSNGLFSFQGSVLSSLLNNINFMGKFIMKHTPNTPESAMQLLSAIVVPLVAIDFAKSMLKWQKPLTVVGAIKAYKFLKRKTEDKVMKVKGFYSNVVSPIIQFSFYTGCIVTAPLMCSNLVQTYSNVIHSDGVSFGTALILMGICATSGYVTYAGITKSYDNIVVALKLDEENERLENDAQQCQAK